MQDLALGIDIGGTNTVFGIVNRRGEILTQNAMPTRGYATAEAFIDALAGRILPMIDKAGRAHMAGAGVGAPNGNYYTGEIAYAPNLEWGGSSIPLARLVEEALGLKTTVTNDANAATIGEMMYGAAKGMKDFIMVTLGTGVGSGFVANGQLIYGHDGFAGELGHVIAVPDGRECGCGRRGCLEAYASATGIVRTARGWLEQHRGSSVLQAKTVTARAIAEAAEAGDRLALELFDFTGKILGECLGNVVAITSPEAVILFGGLARAGNIILEPTNRYMEETMLRIYKGKVKLLLSGLPEADAAILGASALVW